MRFMEKRTGVSVECEYHGTLFFLNGVEPEQVNPFGTRKTDDSPGETTP